MTMNIRIKSVQSPSRHTPRFHCGTCSQPVAPGEWVRISYGYEGRDRAYLACPVCLNTQHLLPSWPHQERQEREDRREEQDPRRQSPPTRRPRA
jgi:hypothetical protein